MQNSSTPVICQPPLTELLEALLNLKERILRETELEKSKLDLEKTSQASMFSILNALNYVVMRREELHPLQSNLAEYGLSSLGRVEPHVMTNIDAVLNVLSKVTTCKPYETLNQETCVDYQGGYRQLRQRSENLFGSSPKGRSEYIMVTMPTQAAIDITLVESFLKAGMNNARINCAHDNESVWLKIIENIRIASKKNQQECKILMDLAGHKIRTGQIYASKTKREKHKDKLKSPRLHQGDFFILCKDMNDLKESLSLFDVPTDVAVTCTYPAIIDLVEVNQSIWIDDGKIGTIVKEKHAQALLLQVKQVGPKGVRLKEEKGINLPQTVLNLPTLSKKDREDLNFVSQHADLVGLSFTECAKDVLYLQAFLEDLGNQNLPILAKIETADGVRNLPDILVQSLAQNIDLGIMIARGDLAVELGSVRMAEIQDEILRLCESAHIPVVWATQVMESLAKQGVISRPEISDAAMSQRAECVMLNKGPYIVEAVRILSEVLQRMEAHQFKSHTHMRALHW